jgi:hypothetical protein
MYYKWYVARSHSASIRYANNHSLYYRVPESKPGSSKLNLKPRGPFCNFYLDFLAIVTKSSASLFSVISSIVDPIIQSTEIPLERSSFFACVISCIKVGFLRLGNVCQIITKD